VFQVFFQIGNILFEGFDTLFSNFCTGYRFFAFEAFADRDVSGLLEFVQLYAQVTGSCPGIFPEIDEFR